MKKILYSLIALLAVGFTACAEFEEPVVENYGKGPGIGVAAVTSDSTITLTMTVDAKNTTYYAYALYEGATETPNAEQLLKATAGGKEAAMLKVEDEDAKWDGVKSVSFTGLMPNTEYHIYAVASSKFGVIGAIADTLVLTTDGLSPYVTKAAQDSTTFAVKFSEEIAVGKGKVSAVYYESWGDFSVATPVEAENITVSVAGNVVGIALENVPAGAVAFVSWEAGAFVDAVGNACNALVSGIGATGLVGLYGQMPNATIDAVEKNPVNEGAFADWTTFVGVVKYPTAIFDLRADVDENGESLHEVELGSLKVVYSSEGYEATIDVKTWAVRNDSLLFMLPMEPDFGMVVDVIVGANVVRDINGNMNVEFATEDAWLRSYGLTAAGIAGKYTANFYVQDADKKWVPASEEITISAIEGVQDSVLINGVFGMETPIKAVFDGDYATITVKHIGYVYSDEQYDYYTYEGGGSGADIVFVYDPKTGVFATKAYLCIAAAQGGQLVGLAAVSAQYTMTPSAAEEKGAE